MLFSSLFRSSRHEPKPENQIDSRPADFHRVVTRVRELYVSGLLQDAVLLSECAQLFGPVLTGPAAVPVPASVPGAEEPWTGPAASAAPISQSVHRSQERSLPIHAEAGPPPERLKIMIKTAEAQIPARLSLPLFEERQVELTDASSSPASRAKRVLAIDKKTAFRPLAAAEELPPAPRTVKITSHIAVRMPTTTSSMSSRTIMPAEPSMVRVKDLQIDEYASEPSAEVQPVEKRQLKPILRFS